MEDVIFPFVIRISIGSFTANCSSVIGTEMIGTRELLFVKQDILEE
jgi:hypothetical protein